MKAISSLGSCLVCCLVLALVSGGARAEDTAVYKINKIEPALIDSPDLTAGNYRKQTKSKAKWLEVDLSFERADRNSKSFSGDVVVNYYILLNNAAAQADGMPTLLTGSITHSDIPEGKQLHAAAFVSPQALQKLFGGKIPATISQTLIDLGVTITANGDLAAISTLKGSIAGDKGWWDTGSDKMTTTTGLVLEKEKTPFAPLSWDYYLPANVSP